MADPLPCPWCPKPTEIYWVFEPCDPLSVPRERYYCAECGASGPLEDSQLEALAAWNRRADGWRDPKTGERPAAGEWVLFLVRDELVDLHYGEFRDPRDWRDGDDGFHCRIDACERTYPVDSVLCWMPEPPPPGDR